MQGDEVEEFWALRDVFSIQIAVEHYLATTKRIGRFPRKISDLTADDITRAVYLIPRAQGKSVPNKIAFGKIFNNDRVFRHGYLV